MLISEENLFPQKLCNKAWCFSTQKRNRPTWNFKQTFSFFDANWT